MIQSPEEWLKSNNTTPTTQVPTIKSTGIQSPEEWLNSSTNTPQSEGPSKIKRAGVGLVSGLIPGITSIGTGAAGLAFDTIADPLSLPEAAGKLLLQGETLLPELSSRIVGNKERADSLKNLRKAIGNANIDTAKITPWNNAMKKAGLIDDFETGMKVFNERQGNVLSNIRENTNTPLAQGKGADYWIDVITTGLGYAVPSAGVAAATGGGSLANVGRNLFVLEAGQNRQQVKDELIAAGTPVEKAKEKANANFVIDLAIGKLTSNLGMFNPNIKNRLVKAAASIPEEVIQELAQTANQNVNTGKSPFENFAETAVVSALFGGIMGGAMPTQVTQEHINKLVKEAETKQQEIEQKQSEDITYVPPPEDVAEIENVQLVKELWDEINNDEAFKQDEYFSIKEDQQLIDEAKQYGSAKEFIKAKTDPLYEFKNYNTIEDKNIARGTVKEAIKDIGGIKNVSRGTANINDIVTTEKVNMSSNRAKLVIDEVNSGIRTPIIINEYGEVMDGHHRLNAYKDLGITEIPVVAPKDTVFVKPISESELIDIYNKANGQQSTNNVQLQYDNGTTDVRYSIRSSEGAQTDGVRDVVNSGATSKNNRIYRSRPNGEQGNVQSLIGNNSSDIRTVEQISNGELTPINDSNLDTLETIGFDSGFINQVKEYSTTNSPIKFIQVSNTFRGSNNFNAFVVGGNTLVINPESKENINQDLARHEIGGHGWISSVTNDKVTELWESITESDIVKAWSGDTTFRYYANSEIVHLAKKIAISNSISGNAALTLVKNSGFKIVDIKDSLDIEDKVSDLNTYLTDSGFINITFDARTDIIANEHIARIAERAVMFTEQDTAVGTYANDVINNTLTFGNNKNSEAFAQSLSQDQDVFLLKQQIDLMKDTLKNHPAKRLSKFIGKEGDIGEDYVTARSKAAEYTRNNMEVPVSVQKSANRAQRIVNIAESDFENYGFMWDDSDVVNEQVKEYITRREQLRQLEQQYKDITKPTEAIGKLVLPTETIILTDKEAKRIYGVGWSEAKAAIEASARIENEYRVMQAKKYYSGALSAMRGLPQATQDRLKIKALKVTTGKRYVSLLEEITNAQIQKDILQKISTEKNILKRNIGLLRHLNNVSPKLVSSIKKDMGITGSVSSLTESELRKVLNELKTRITFIEENNLKPTYQRPLTRDEIRKISKAMPKNKLKVPKPVKALGKNIKNTFITLGENIKAISKDIFYGLEDHAYNIAKYKNDVVAPLVNKMDSVAKSLPYEDRNDFNISLLTANYAAATDILVENGKDPSILTDVRTELENAFAYLRSVGVDVKYLQDFFPRSFAEGKEQELEALVQSEIALQNKQKMLEKGRPLTQEEESSIVEKYFRGFDSKGKVLLADGRFAESRSMIIDNPAIADLYEKNTAKALEKYLIGAYTKFQDKMFFKGYEFDQSENVLDQFVNDKVKTGEVSVTELGELRDLLQVYFGKETQDPAIRAMMNFTYVMGLSNPTSFIPQALETINFLVQYGLPKNLSISTSEIGASGLIEVNDSSMSKMSELLTTPMRKGDELAARVGVNAIASYIKKQAKNNSQILRNKIEYIYGKDNADTVIKSVANQDLSKPISSEFQRLIYSEIVNVRVLSKLDKSKTFIKNPFFGVFKNYTVKMITAIANTGNEEISLGKSTNNKALVARGVARKTSLIIGLLLAGASATAIKDLLRGKDPAKLGDYVLGAFLALFGLSRFTGYNIQKKDYLGVVTDIVAPAPVTIPTQLLSTIAKDIDSGTTKFLYRVPIVGDVVQGIANRM